MNYWQLRRRFLPASALRTVMQAAMDSKTAKAALRKVVKANLKRLSREAVESQSTVATGTLLRSAPYKQARNISVYLSMPGTEIQTNEIVIDALRQGKGVFVPYISATSPVMEMMRLRDLEDFGSLKPDSWGIPSLPLEGLHEREHATGRLDLLLMPAVAFDAGMRRLGHGKGYYDRYLEHYAEHVGEAGTMPHLSTSKPISFRYSGCIAFSWHLSKSASVESALNTSLQWLTSFLAGLALTEQVMSPEHSIPTTENDWLVDAIISGDGDVLQRGR